MRIALDAMGTDLAPAAEVAGAIEALHAYDGDDVEIVLVGDEETIRARTVGLEGPRVRHRDHRHVQRDKRPFAHGGNIAICVGALRRAFALAGSMFCWRR